MTDREKLDELRTFIGMSSNLSATLWKCVNRTRDGSPVDENYNELRDQYMTLKNRLTWLERNAA